MPEYLLAQRLPLNAIRSINEAVTAHQLSTTKPEILSRIAR